MDIQAVTDADIQADPLAVLDLCVGVLEDGNAPRIDPNYNPKDLPTVEKPEVQIGIILDFSDKKTGNWDADKKVKVSAQNTVNLWLKDNVPIRQIETKKGAQEGVGYLYGDEDDADERVYQTNDGTLVYFDKETLVLHTVDPSDPEFTLQFRNRLTKPISTKSAKKQQQSNDFASLVARQRHNREMASSVGEMTSTVITTVSQAQEGAAKLQKAYPDSMKDFPIGWYENQIIIGMDTFNDAEMDDLVAASGLSETEVNELSRQLYSLGDDNHEELFGMLMSKNLEDVGSYFSFNSESSADDAMQILLKLFGLGRGAASYAANNTLFDSFLADGRYDHIHLDDLQMHPYANAAKERQPTANTPLLVQKNRRGDLYLIAGVKRYEMALDADMEYLPAVILPVIEGYGDPVIKRVLNAYTGSIDSLALMAAIEDAVIERAGKKVMFDGLGGDISTITDLDIQNDPLGVLEACLVALESPTSLDVNNPATILRYVSKIADQLATASDAQKAISLDYIDELQLLMRNTDYSRDEFRKIVKKLVDTVLVEASTNTQKLVMNEYMENGGTLVYDLELYKSTETYQRAMKESISHRNAQIYEAWDIHLTETRELWKQLNSKSKDPMTSDEQLNELKKAYDEKSMLRWEEFSAAYVDAWRPEKDRIEAEMKGKGQQIIDDVLSASKVSTDAATQWAAQQIITTAAEKQLVKMGYPVDQVRKDLAEFYQVTNGAISHIGIDYSGKKDRAYTINSTSKVADKWMYIGSHFDKRVLFHEAGHHIESDKAALAASTYFLKFKRGDNDNLYKLKNLAPGAGYKSSEVAYKGGFFNPYVGKYYEHGSTEVWSMGVESLYDPVVLAERAAVDPQMFAMIMGGIKLPKNPLVEVSDALFSEQMKQQGSEKEDAEKLRENSIKKIVSLVAFDKTPAPNVEQALFDYSPKYHAGSTFHGRYNDWYVFAVQSVMNPRTNRRGKGYVFLEYKKRNEYFVPEILTVKAAGKLDADEIKLYVAALSVSEPISARQVVMGRLSDERVQEILSKLTGGSNE